ncbi:cytoplasmic chaperone TorD [Calditerrivibrio nitroreducens DSM 19672]|uniref:Cytoplasmic chaperone TorD n=2 Tax=Calditerrivibrio nitroreducens TaxID=477976 RepID=E4TGV9_CALNY|nr:cytoplasmic chaperone TorD [Calditerrivibrio nitroreducens DSM 19672]
MILDMKETKWIDEKDGQDFLEYIAYLSDIAAYLSLLYRYPFVEVYKSIKDYYEDFKLLAAEEYGVSLPQLPDMENMEVEYVRLFKANLQGVVAPLYSSVYTSDEGLVLRDSTLKLRELMMDHGFALKEDMKEIEDNLYVMLEFLSVMLKKMAEGDADSVPAAFIVVKDYILPMKEEFCKRLKNGANLEYFKAVSEFLSLFVEELDPFFEFFCGKNI